MSALPSTPSLTRKGSLPLLLLLSLLIALGTSVLMSLSVWYIKKTVQHQYNLDTAQTTQTVQSNAQEYIDQHRSGLDSMRKPLGEHPTVRRDRYRDLASQTLSRHKAFSAINLIDRDFIVEDVYPFAPNQGELNLDLKSRFDALPVAYRAITQRRVEMSDLLALVQGGRGILLFAPVLYEGRWSGLLQGVIGIRRFCEVFLEPHLASGYDYTLIDESDGEELFTSIPPPHFQRVTPYDTYLTLHMGHRTWWVVLHPKSPPLVLLPLVLTLLLELALGTFLFYLLWKPASRE